jgi:nitroimidazol reductase NimA-like FMN-containing flavoprotein (pyridoxamine 5'-phosphate oxidase superfamily)
MPREHADIKMTPEELREFLAADDRLVIATNGPDGSPWADAAACFFHQERMYFRVPSGTKTLENIRHDDRVCCVVERKPTVSSYYDIKGAMLHGHATPLGADGAAAGAAADEVRRRLADLPDPVEPGRRDGEIFSVGLDDSTSFTFEKIRYRYQDRTLTEDRTLA